MARNIRKVTASTGLPKIPPLKSEEGKVTDVVLGIITSALRAIVLLLNGRVSMGDGAQSSWSGNMNGQYREFTTTGVADTQMTIDHGLGRVPIGFIPINNNKAYCLYNDEPYGWNEDYITLKCDTSSVLVKIWLF